MYTKYPKRNAVKDYFPLPNEIFDLNLCYGEIAVYAYLLRCEDRKTFQCYPSYKAIGKALKMSRNTVCKYVRQLEEKELIITSPTNVRTARGEKRNGNLLYTILPIEQAKKYFYDWKMDKLQEQVSEENQRKRIARLTG